MVVAVPPAVVCVPVVIPPKVLVAIPGMVLAGAAAVVSAGANAFDIVFGTPAAIVVSCGDAGGGTRFVFAGAAALTAPCDDTGVSALRNPEEPDSKVIAGIAFSAAATAVAAIDS